MDQILHQKVLPNVHKISISSQYKVASQLIASLSFSIAKVHIKQKITSNFELLWLNNFPNRYFLLNFSFIIDWYSIKSFIESKGGSGHYGRLKFCGTLIILEYFSVSWLVDQKAPVASTQSLSTTQVIIIFYWF